MIAIKRKCVECGKVKIIEIPLEAYNNWINGMAIQDALYMLSEDDREMLMSDLCSKCFDKYVQGICWDGDI